MFASPPRVEESLFALRVRGIEPILTHPERNAELAAPAGVERLAGWVARGLLVQVTGDSLTGAWGRRAETAALELLRRGLCHFVASDAHSSAWRPPLLRPARAVVERLAGQDAGRLLFEENPGRAVRGERIAAQPSMESMKQMTGKRFSFQG